MSEDISESDKLDPYEGEEEYLTENEKKTTPGLIYISFLPPNMTPLHIRQIFEKYGEVGRIFLQPEEHGPSKKKKVKPKYNKGSFSEGWVEMGDKKLAKRLAMTLNNTLIEDGKKSKFSNYQWNVKYLHRFRWQHLTERLAHERESRKQKMRIEQEQARKETSAFLSNVAASKRMASIRERKIKQGEEWRADKVTRKVKQRKTVEELRAIKRRKLEGGGEKVDVEEQRSQGEAPSQRKTVLSKIFSL